VSAFLVCHFFYLVPAVNLNFIYWIDNTADESKKLAETHMFIYFKAYTNSCKIRLI